LDPGPVPRFARRPAIRPNRESVNPAVGGARRRASAYVRLHPDGRRRRRGPGFGGVVRPTFDSGRRRFCEAAAV